MKIPHTLFFLTKIAIILQALGDHWDFPSMRTVSYGKNSAPSWWEPFEERRLETKREDPLARQLQHFVAVARGLEIPRVSIRDGFLNMVAVEAIRRAAETGQRIKLNTLIE